MVSASLRIAIVVIAASFIGYTVTVDAIYTYTSLVSRICNGKTYSFLTDQFNMPSAITGIIANDILINHSFDVYDSIVNNNYILYGHGSCFRKLSRDECETCMISARYQMFSECSWHGAGAQIDLTGCKLRYEEYYFGPPK